MTQRGQTRRVNVGNVAIGMGANVSVQSMTNTRTGNVDATLAQVVALADAGADIVRVTINDTVAADAIGALVDASPVPLVADVHFDYRLAIRAIESGVKKLRINPGNIGGELPVDAVVACAKRHNIPIRIGVNGGSLEKHLLETHGGPTPEAMVASAMSHAKMLESRGFYDTVISVKCSNVSANVAAYRKLSTQCDYPLHLGVTEAGGGQIGVVKGAVGIGALLLDGIGDTVRVSLTGNPVPEIAAGKAILRACGLLREGIEIISCPTCGRCAHDLENISLQVEKRTRHIKVALTVAIMGCVVNGPGEARQADLGIAMGDDSAAFFLKDKLRNACQTTKL